MHLEPAGVGQRVPRPPSEPMQPPEVGHHVGAWSEHQVVRVRQDHLGAERIEVTAVQAFDCTSGSDGHEGRDLIRPTWSDHPTGAR